ncbi:MAG: polysaccharide deacetylase family protein [Caldisericaceae bacterium]
MRILISVFIILLLLFLITPSTTKANLQKNIPIAYFENAVYSLGRLYGITKSEEILSEYNGLFSNKSTFCVVLMYHNIYKSKSKRINSYDVSFDDFKKQLAILKNYDFTSISLEDLYAFLLFNKKIPERSVILTFDDGFKSEVEVSNLLKENGFKGVSSLITGFIGSVWEVSKKEIEILKNNGFEFSSHSHLLHNFYLKLTKTHRYKDIENDIKKSKEYFNNTLKINVIAFTYPQGAYDEATRNTLIKLGFKLGFGLYKKPFNKFGDDPYYISRYEISERLKNSNPTKFRELIKSIIETNN